MQAGKRLVVAATRLPVNVGLGYDLGSQTREIGLCDTQFALRNGRSKSHDHLGLEQFGRRGPDGDVRFSRNRLFFQRGR